MTRAHYSAAFKANAVRRMIAPGQSTTELSRELGVHTTQLYRWRQEAGRTAGVSKSRPRRTSTITTPITTGTLAESVMPVAGVTSEPRPKQRPQDWSHDEKIAAVIESMSLTEEQLGGFLRQRGLYRATLEEWRESVFRGARAELGGRATKADAADAKRIRELERELSRKDKALAEAAALLVLQKKMRALLGGEDDDTKRSSGR